MARLSDAKLRAIPIPDAGQKLYTDDTLLGFGVRVSQGGTKTFVLTLGSERRRITLGHYPMVSLADARLRAQRILRDRELGIEHLPSPPFSAVHREYMAGRDDKRLNTRRADVQNLRPFLVLSQRKIGDITSDQLKDILDGIEAPVRKLHAFNGIGHLFKFAVKRGYIDRNPIDRLYAPKKQPPRERVLTDDELKAVWDTAAVYGWPFGTIVRLLILTGQRRTQIAELRRDWIDFDQRLITFPADVMKAKKRHVIPFGLMTEAIFRRVPSNEDGLFFYGRTGNAFVGFGNYGGKFQADSGVDFHLHDLRRSMATRWQDIGIEIATTEKMLSHSAVTGGLVGIYQRSSYITQMRAAVQKWEEYLQALLPTSEGRDG